MIVGVASIFAAGFLGWTGIGCFSGVENSLKNVFKSNEELAKFNLTLDALKAQSKQINDDLASYNVQVIKPKGIVINEVNPKTNNKTREILIRNIIDEIMQLSKANSIDLIRYVPENIDLAPKPEEPPTTPAPIPNSSQPPADQVAAAPPPSISTYIDQVAYTLELRGDYQGLSKVIKDLSVGLPVYKEDNPSVLLGRRVVGMRSINIEINKNNDPTDQRSSKAATMSLALNIVVCKMESCS